jgi:phosphate-selective porin
LGANIELKGEYAQTCYGSDDFGLIRQEGLYLQGGYKLAGLNLDLPLINNIELVGRYDTLNYFNSGIGAGSHTQRYTAGFIYYFSNTLLFEGDYESLHNTDSTQPNHQFMLQLSYGF